MLYYHDTQHKMRDWAMDIKKLLICIFASLTLTLSGCATMSSTWDWFFEDDEQVAAEEQMEMDDEDLIADEDLIEEELIADEFADEEMDEEADEMMDEEDEMMDDEAMEEDDYGDSPVAFTPPANTIYFDYKSTKVGANALNLLQMHAKFLRDNSDAIAVLSGHTDSVASADYNKKLALKRAEAVAEALVEMGVDPEQISLVSKGMSDPAASEDEEGSAALNRRVEINYR